MTVLPAFLEIFVPVAVAFLVLGLILGWLGHAWWARRRPWRRPPGIAAEWAELWQAVQDEMEGK